MIEIDGIKYERVYSYGYMWPITTCSATPQPILIMLRRVD